MMKKVNVPTHADYLQMKKTVDEYLSGDSCRPLMVIAHDDDKGFVLDTAIQEADKLGIKMTKLNYWSDAEEVAEAAKMPYEAFCLYDPYISSADGTGTTAFTDKNMQMLCEVKETLSDKKLICVSTYILNGMEDEKYNSLVSVWGERFDIVRLDWNRQCLLDLANELNLHPLVIDFLCHNVAKASCNSEITLMDYPLSHYWSFKTLKDASMFFETNNLAHIHPAYLYKEVYAYSRDLRCMPLLDAIMMYLADNGKLPSLEEFEAEQTAGHCNYDAIGKPEWRYWKPSQIK